MTGNYLFGIIIPEKRFKPAINLPTDIHTNNYTDFWKMVRDQVNDDFLYPRNFDVSRVILTLRQAKVIHADLFNVANSIKFRIILEGGQPAIFKIMFV